MNALDADHATLLAIREAVTYVAALTTPAVDEVGVSPEPATVKLVAEAAVTVPVRFKVVLPVTPATVTCWPTTKLLADV